MALNGESSQFFVMSCLFKYTFFLLSHIEFFFVFSQSIDETGGVVITKCFFFNTQHSNIRIFLSDQIFLTALTFSETEAFPVDFLT